MSDQKSAGYFKRERDPHKMPLNNIAEYSYSYEAALKQLNIKPESLSITDSDDFEYSMGLDRVQTQMQKKIGSDFQAAREAESKLQQLTTLRVKTLEQIILDKTEQVHALENELKMAQQDHRSTQVALEERLIMLEQYESRFAQIRSFIEQKEFEISDLNSEVQKLQQVNVDLQEQQRRSKQILREQADQTTAQQQQSQFMFQEKEAEWHAKLKSQQQEHQRVLAERDRLDQAKKFKFDAQMNELMDAKDNEIKQLQLAVTKTYKDMAGDQHHLQLQIFDLTAQLASAQKVIETKSSVQNENEQMLQSHISKLKEHINNIQEMNSQLDEQNKSMQLEMQALNQRLIDQYQLSEQERDQHEQRYSELEIQCEQREMEMKQNQASFIENHNLQLKIKQREIDQKQKQLDRLTHQISEKEIQLKHHLDDVLREWQEKCEDLQEQLAEAEARTQGSFENEREIRDQIRKLKHESRQMKSSLADKEKELFNLQAKYEEVLNLKINELDDAKRNHATEVDKLKFEIDYLRKESTQLMKGNPPLPQIQTANDQFMIVGDQQFRSSGQSHFKPTQPSPQVQAFMKSTFKQSLNDSLDKLQREFLQGYNEVMMESEAKHMAIVGARSASNGFQFSKQQQRAQSVQQKPLDQVNQLLIEENEMLQNQVHQMKIDFDALITKVRDELQNQNYRSQDPNLEKAIVAKSQKINELEKKLRYAEDRVASLTVERDQLIQISSELRADLNRQQRLVNELISQDPSQHAVRSSPVMGRQTPAKNLIAKDLNQDIDFGGGTNQKGMFDEKLMRHSIETIEQNKDQLLGYGKKLNQIAGELQYWVKQQNDTSPIKEQSPKRSLQILKKKASPKKSRSRSHSNEGNAFIKRIDDLRKNLEIEGHALQGLYKKVDSEMQQNRKQSDKQTVSQIQAANRLLQAQNKKLKDNQIGDRAQLIEKTKGRVRNYAEDVRNNEVEIGDFEDDNIDVVNANMMLGMNRSSSPDIRKSEARHSRSSSPDIQRLNAPNNRIASARVRNYALKEDRETPTIKSIKSKQSPKRSSKSPLTRKDKVRDYRLQGQDTKSLHQTKIVGAELII